MNLGEENTQYLLHHDVHTRWGKSRLWFARLGFKTFTTEDVIASLRNFLTAVSCESFAIYEILGDCDLLLRLWLPLEKSKVQIREQLTNHLLLAELDENRVTLCSVESVDRHWVFEDPETGKIDADQNFLNQALTSQYIERLNTTLVGLVDQGLSEDELDDLINHGLAGSLFRGSDATDLQSPGIKFVTFVYTHDLGEGQARRLRNNVRAKIEILSNLVNAEGDLLVRELSLYWTPNESEVEFVIMGKIRADSFHVAVRDLIGVIVDKGTRNFGAHPRTYILAEEAFSAIQEQLPMPAAADVARRQKDPGLRELLERPEDLRIEVKATAQVDMTRMIFTGNPPEPSEELFIDGVVRAVAAFLNSPRVAVGHLVVGGLELTSSLQRARESSNQEVRDRFDQFDEFGRYLITGIQPDLDALKLSGSNISDVDDLIRNLQQRLATALNGSGGRSAESMIEIGSEELMNQTLIVVRVTTSAPRTWFHYRGVEGNGEKFTVRVGNASRDLSRDDEHEFRDQWERSR